MYDAVVVGASVAGSATAIHLAKRGRNVLLVDRDSFPRRKCCGEGLFPSGVAELGELGVLDEIEDASRLITSLRFTIDGCSAAAPVGGPGHHGLGVQRLCLDKALQDRARLDGVEVRTDCEARTRLAGDRFVVELDGAPVEARVIVGADGLRSGLRRLAGLDVTIKNRRYGVSAHVQLDEPASEQIQVYFEPGYEVYVTPAGKRVANVALLLGRELSHALGGRLEEGYLALIAKALPAGSFELIDSPLATGPFPAEARSVWRHNLVLVGDAAGFFDGVTGDGMTASLLTARRCAAAVDAWLASGSPAPFRDYERYRRRLGRNSRLLGRMVLALAEHRQLGKRAVENLSRRPGTFAKLVAINGGELGVKDLRPRDLLALALGV